MSYTLTVYLIRHGQTGYNAEHRIQGQSDTLLDDLGIAQAMAVAKRLKDAPIDRIISSDLSRASTTAKTILKLHPDATYEEDIRWRENSYGALEHRDKPQVAAYLLKTKTTLADHMEDQEHFAARLSDAWDAMLKTELPLLQQTNRTVVITSHGGGISELCRGYLSDHLLYDNTKVVLGRIGNTAVTKFTINASGQGKFDYFANTSHLTGVVLTGDE